MFISNLTVLKMPVCFQDMKCNLTIETFIENSFLFDDGKCVSCKQPIGTHCYQYRNLFFLNGD